MNTKVQKWGNSLAMRLPKELARSLNLRAGSRITFLRKNYSFEVKPEVKIKIPKYTLENMEMWKNKSKENFLDFYSKADVIYDKI